jgi:hypothetical protein
MHPVSESDGGTGRKTQKAVSRRRNRDSDQSSVISDQSIKEQTGGWGESGGMGSDLIIEIVSTAIQEQG